MAKQKIEVISGDWREGDGVIEDLVKAMKKFGLHVHDLGQGSDMHIYAISNKKISQQDLKEIMMED